MCLACSVLLCCSIDNVAWAGLQDVVDRPVLMVRIDWGSMDLLSWSPSQFALFVVLFGCLASPCWRLFGRCESVTGRGQRIRCLEVCCGSGVVCVLVKCICYSDILYSEAVVNSVMLDVSGELKRS